jgi:cytochrome oxidase Cu insertion factor (SCO1/SenC/PrrC family)
MADMPTKDTLMRGVFNGELGSVFPGPEVGMTAPDFTLPTADGKGSITLSQLGKGKPVALIFGSFT